MYYFLILLKGTILPLSGCQPMSETLGLILVPVIQKGLDRLEKIQRRAKKMITGEPTI